MASLLRAASVVTGFFCFEMFTEFGMGPVILRLVESPETRPGGRPSSSPVRGKKLATESSRYVNKLLKNKDNIRATTTNVRQQKVIIFTERIK